MWVRNKLQKVRLRFNKRYQELKRLSKLKRYTPGSFSWEGAVLNFPDAASFLFTYKEIFEEQIYKFETRNQSPYIIDCGANIGMSVIYFKQLYPNANIIAFEPEKKIFKYLKDNIAALNLAKVELKNEAVWKEDGSLLFLNEGADASRISLVGDMADKKSSYSVDAVRLSRFINREVDFLKLDIEGAEFEVLKEIEPQLKFVKRLFVEFHSFDKREQQLDILLLLLKRNGYIYYIDTPVRMRTSPFVDKDTFLSFNFFLNIYAERNN
jgi:FkbM family methyltransferase